MVNATLRQFYPWNEPRYPMYFRLVGFEVQYGKVWRRVNLLLPLGFEAQNFRPIASQYTGYAIPVHTFRHTSIFNTSSTRVLHIPKKKKDFKPRQGLRLLTPASLPTNQQAFVQFPFVPSPISVPRRYNQLRHRPLAIPDKHRSD